MLFSLVYTSRAASPMTRGDLVDLLQESRTHNRAARLTGLLLYRDQTFVQLLEGQRQRVESLYEAIRTDPRHGDVTTVLTRDQLGRQFPDWSMAFTNLDPAPLEVPGWNDLLDRPSPAGDDPAGTEAELVRDLLELFDTSR